ncbi:M23 family metallopeptidase [Oscillatoria sp. FACHB-1407]|nr:M23 family metallopeptidase [Oscillatoria sp. FACHB-1407]
MNVWRWLLGSSVLVWLLLSGNSQAMQRNSPDGAIALKQTDSLCPQPALSRVTRHRIQPGETLVSIAQRFDLIPETLMGMNPVLRSGSAPVGTEILIPPYNGIRVEVPTGRTWRDIATTYGVRADVLFEINGCQTAPRVVFVPGVNWSPNPIPASVAGQTSRVLRGYPLPSVVPVVVGHGWQVDPSSGEVVFHSGVRLAAAAGTPVLATGDGVIAFAANQGNYGNLIVINHNEGLQTRYAQLATIDVQIGQAVRAGDRIGTVGATGSAREPYLRFEVRSNSDLGWVAQDPGAYLQNLRVGR